jgi:hypothetical protein
MPGFFKIDIDDFDEVWTAKQNSDLFLVYAALLRDAWRMDRPKPVRERHFEITLWQNQLILHIRQVARALDLAESTLRDRMGRLEALEAIRIDEPVPHFKVVTILQAYTYGDHGERTPCVYRAPSVVDLQTQRDNSESGPSPESVNKLLHNKLHQPYTARLGDGRLRDSEKQDRLVKESSFGSTEDKARIDDLAAKIIAESPDLTPMQAREWALTDTQPRGEL